MYNSEARQREDPFYPAMIMMPFISLLIASATTVMAGNVTMITHGPPDVSQPLETTNNLPARYGIGLPLQVSATEAALFCNLRVIAPGMFDYEDGTDVLIFDSLKDLRTAKPIAISRNRKQVADETGKTRLLVKFPVAAGFWPLGAKAVDGSRHPGEGKGFGVCQALSFETDEKGLFTWTKPFIRYVEMLQLSYSDAQFQVTGREISGPDQLPLAGPDGWQLVSPGLTSAIPQGNDLLLPVLARRKGVGQSGVCRWQWQKDQWIATGFVAVGLGSEPSLVRGGDGELLFTTRLGSDEGSTVVVWQSTDEGKTWQEIVSQAKVRCAAPISINRTACGTPFIATSPHGGTRSRLSFWTIEGTHLGASRLIRDCTEEFGKRPKEAFWAIDHPASAVVRLADSKWHALLAYRVKTYFLPTRGRKEPIMPQTGCYVEEILSTGPAVPVWQF